MTVVPADRRIELTYRGRTCWFDATPVHGLANPGVIYRTLQAGRFYEHAFLDYIRSLQIRGVYVDVGSCIGTHAVFFALMCPSTHVHAFEPRAHLFERVLTNAALNAQSDKVTAYPLALSDKPGEVTVSLDGSEHVLTCRRLDDVIAGRVDVIKIDVEGMEPQVIDGARRTLARWRPRIFAEAGHKEQYEALVGCLARHGYRPTGRVFNATPTYEFVAEPRSAWQRSRVIPATEVPARARRALGRLLRRFPTLRTAASSILRHRDRSSS